MQSLGIESSFVKNRKTEQDMGTIMLLNIMTEARVTAFKVQNTKKAL